ncbi:MAG: precorrin-6A reductase [Anaerofustis sp.]
MKQVLVFAGTSEGRRLTSFLSENGISMHVCVATDYGDEMIEKNQNTILHTGRMNAEEMIALISSNSFDLVIDATHPYAAEVSRNISEACNECNVESLRIRRDTSNAEDFVSVAGVDEAVRYLNATQGNILLTTGSKDLDAYTKVTDYQKRIFPRILPMQDGLTRCIELGFSSKNIICMQGPFTEEMNTATLNQIGADYLVTKESGASGGFEEKLRGANAAGATVIVIGRPNKEHGMTEAQAYHYLNDRYGIKESQKQERIADLRFPMFFDLSNRSILIVGGGNIATRRAEVLTQFGCRIEVVAKQCSPGIKEMAEHSDMILSERDFDPKDIAEQFFVLAATDDSDLNRKIHQLCEHKHIFCNTADNKTTCDFYFPSVISKNEIVIGLAGNGADHAATKKMADKLRHCLKNETEENA